MCYMLKLKVTKFKLPTYSQLLDVFNCPYTRVHKEHAQQTSAGHLSRIFCYFWSWMASIWHRHHSTLPKLYGVA